MLSLNDKVLRRIFSPENYSARCYLFRDLNSPAPPIPQSAQKVESSCFRFLSTIQSNCNRVAYLPKLNRTKVLTNKQRYRWIELSKDWKMLPPYVQPKHMEETFVLDVNISPSLLYLYLCQLRHMEEFPDIVRITIYLVDLGVDPYLALCAASKIGCSNGGHNYFSFYGYGSENGDSTINVLLALALKWFANNPTKYDKRQCEQGMMFNCSSTITNIIGSLHPILVAIKELDDPLLVDIMATTTLAEAKEQFIKFKGRKT